MCMGPHSHTRAPTEPSNKHMGRTTGYPKHDTQTHRRTNAQTHPPTHTTLHHNITTTQRSSLGVWFGVCPVPLGISFPLSFLFPWLVSLTWAGSGVGNNSSLLVLALWIACGSGGTPKNNIINTCTAVVNMGQLPLSIKWEGEGFVYVSHSLSPCGEREMDTPLPLSLKWEGEERDRTKHQQTPLTLTKKRERAVWPTPSFFHVKDHHHHYYYHYNYNYSNHYNSKMELLLLAFFQLAYFVLHFLYSLAENVRKTVKITNYHNTLQYSLKTSHNSFTNSLSQPKPDINNVNNANSSISALKLPQNKAEIRKKQNCKKMNCNTL